MPDLVAEARIDSLLADTVGGVWGSEPGADEHDVLVVRSTDFRNDGRLTYDNAARRSVGERVLERRALRRGDILLEKSGGGPKQPVGRVVFVEEDRPNTVFANFVQLLRPSEDVEPRWLFYALWLMHARGETLALQTQTTGIRNLKTKEYLARTITVPTREEQRRIVSLVSGIDDAAVRAEDACEAAKRLLKVMSDALLVPGGDWETLPPAWELSTLGAVADVRSGITKGRKTTEPLIETPFLRAANVQDGWLDLAEIKTIPATAREIERFMLKRGDVLLIEGGNKTDVGRGWIWEGEVEGCLHQNHVFRARVTDDRIDRRFLAYAIGARPARAHCFARAKQTSNLASLNKTEISALPVPVPPPTEQAEIVARLDALRGVVDSHAAVVDRLHDLRRATLAAVLLGEHQIPDTYDRLLDGAVAVAA